MRESTPESTDYEADALTISS